MKTNRSRIFTSSMSVSLLVGAVGLTACGDGPSAGAGTAGAAGKVSNQGGAGGVAQPTAGGAGGQSSIGVGGTVNPVATGFDKVDVLLMVDNSLGMSEKETLLASAVTQLLNRLTNPDCVDPAGTQAPAIAADPAAACPTGLVREFAPVKDIHVGVITSSLGDFGGDVCPEDGAQNVAQNDHAWLLGALPRTGLGAPFLAWAASDTQDFATAMTVKQNDLRSHIMAATEIGCGYEMGLEAWYRFLVDPKPPVDVLTANQAPNTRGPTDNNILQQRQAFLRPDSMLAILMLSDENDCSLRDTAAYSWVLATASAGFRMWRGSSPCAVNPNDACCYSCMLADASLGVSAACLAQDTSCRQSDSSAKLTLAADNVNVRCRQTKKRFGYDFLFPPSRYVNALTKPQICPDQSYGDLDCDCTEAKAKGAPCVAGASVQNPLFTNLNPAYSPTGPARLDAQAIYLAGILGVPWQDLARDPSASAALEYKTATELDWNLFAPKVNEDDSLATLGDPLMIESFAPRAGTHPITGQAIAGPDAPRLANSINGHEWNTANADLQYACIFSLDAQLSTGATSAVRTCDIAAECGADNGSDAYKVCARRFNGCDCIQTNTGSSTDPLVAKPPQCQAADNSYGNKQYFGVANPGLRQLQVLRGFFEATGSNNAVVGSICPKDLTYANRNSTGYGYNPTMRSLLDRFKERLLKN